MMTETENAIFRDAKILLDKHGTQHEGESDEAYWDRVVSKCMKMCEYYNNSALTLRMCVALIEYLEDVWKEKHK